MGLLVLMSIVSTPKVWTSLSLPDAGIVPTFAVVTLCVVLQPNLGERAAAQKVDDTQQMLCGAHTMCRAAAKPGYSRGLPCWGAAGLEPFPLLKSVPGVLASCPMALAAALAACKHAQKPAARHPPGCPQAPPRSLWSCARWGRWWEARWAC